MKSNTLVNFSLYSWNPQNKTFLSSTLSQIWLGKFTFSFLLDKTELKIELSLDAWSFQTYFHFFYKKSQNSKSVHNNHQHPTAEYENQLLTKGKKWKKKSKSLSRILNSLSIISLVLKRKKIKFYSTSFLFLYTMTRTE